MPTTLGILATSVTVLVVPAVGLAKIPNPKVKTIVFGSVARYYSRSPAV